MPALIFVLLNGAVVFLDIAQNSEFYTYFLIPFLIFIARICDVSIGTVRIILVSKGYKFVAAVMGFIEVIIWIVAIGQIMQNLNSWINYLAYGLGFALGTYIGMIIEKKLSIGKVVVRIITKREADELMEHLIEQDYHLTSMDADGRFGKVKIIFMALRRKQLPELINIINEYNPKAFYTIEDLRYVNDPVAYSPSSFLRKSQTQRAYTKSK